MKKELMPLGFAIFLLITGLFIGSIFTFGMQYWNAEVSREACTQVETSFVSYDPMYGRRASVKEIAIYCSNNERYDIDGVSLNRTLLEKLTTLSEGEKLKLLIHPNANTILELSTDHDTLLHFDETVEKLGSEATAFLFLGLFMYFTAGLSLYHIVLHCKQKRK